MKEKSKNIILVLVILAAAVMQGPNIYRNFSNEGTFLTAQDYPVFGENHAQEVTFPSSGRSMAIFWATWCAPCKLEMSRLKKSVQEKRIDPHSIYAINPFESAHIVKEFLKKEPYPFTFIDAPEVVQKLDIRATPTTLWLDGNEVIKASTGISFVGIWRAENFLEKN